MLSIMAGTSVAQSWYAVQKEGKNAVHASQASELGLQKFQLLGTAFFDQFRQNLSRYLKVPLELSEIKQRSEPFGEFCERMQAQLVFVLILERTVTLVFGAEGRMAHLIVDALFDANGEKTLNSAGNAEAPLSATESRVVIQILGSALTAAVEEVFGRVFGGRVINMMQNLDHASLIENALGSGELILTAEVNGTLGQLSGNFALGLPSSLLSLLQAEESSSRLNSSETLSSRNLRSLAAVPIELSAILAEREMSLAEVRSLGPGAVIILQRLRHLPKAQLCAAGQVLFGGTIVEHQGWHNFLIQQVESADVERAA
jgi:flagellar motor switch protein FliM